MKWIKNITTPLLIAVFVLILDIVSKAMTHAYLPRMGRAWSIYPYGGVGVFKDFYGIEFSLTHQVNHGAAWGMLAEYQVPLLALRMGLILFLIIYALWWNKDHTKDIPLALIISGAIGNVLDYFLYGHVVDMFHFVLWGYDYPVFNVADSAIFLGIVGWLGIAWFSGGQVKKRS